MGDKGIFSSFSGKDLVDLSKDMDAMKPKEESRTPTPWQICAESGEGWIMGANEDEIILPFKMPVPSDLFFGIKGRHYSNAEFICEAVNNYDRLRQENERLRESLKEVRDGYLADPGSDFDWDSWYRKAEEALAKGEGNES